MSNVDKGTHTQRTILKIRAAGIADRLIAFFLNQKDPVTHKEDGEWTLTSEQIRVGLSLLGKTVPDLKAIEQTIEDKRQVRTREDANTLLAGLGYSEEEIEREWARAATQTHH